MLVFMAVIRFFQFFHLHPQKKKSVAHSSLLIRVVPRALRLVKMKIFIAEVPSVID